MAYNETPTKGTVMTNDDFDYQEKSAVKKVAQTANDVLTVIAIGMAVVGLGQLVYDAGKLGVEKIKAKKNPTN